MKWLVRAGIVVAALVVVALGAGLLLPAHRESVAVVDIQAAPEAIYPKVASFKNGWGAWSPFGKAEDPEMELSFEGPEEGVGATQRWHSKKMQDGAMRITKADPQKGVAYELEMPGFKLSGHIDFEGAGGATRLRWTDAYDLGANPFKHLMGPLIDTMMGPKLEQGLKQLKTQVEAKPKL